MVAPGTHLSYDAGDGAHTVHPGQLFSVTNDEGWQKVSYDSVGNVLTNGEFGTGNHACGSLRPQCVRSANGAWHASNPNGNVALRAGRRLEYDVNNRLWRLISTNGEKLRVAAQRSTFKQQNCQMSRCDPPPSHEGDPATGEKPGYQMTSTERQASANDRSRMQFQPKSESNKQGAEMSRYSREMKEKHGLQ